MAIPIIIPLPAGTGAVPYDRPPRSGLIAGSTLALFYSSLPLIGGFLSRDLPLLLGLTVDPLGTMLIYDALAWLSAIASVAVLTMTLLMARSRRYWHTILFCGVFLTLILLIPLQLATVQDLVTVHCGELQSVRVRNYIPGCGF